MYTRLQDANAVMSFREVLAIGFRKKWTVAAAFLVPVLLAVTALFVLTPIYRAETALVVKTGREYLAGSTGENAMSAPTTTQQEEVNSEVAIITSRALIERVINEIGLRNLYPSLLNNPPWSGTVMDAAIDKFDSNLSVVPIKLSNIIGVNFDHSDRQLAIKVLDTLVAEFQARHSVVYSADRALAYQQGMHKDLRDLAEYEQQRQQIKIDNHVYDVDQQRSAYINQLVDAQNHLQDLSSQKTTLEDRVRYLTNARTKVPDLTRSTNTTNADEMAYAQNQMSDLKRTETALLARYSPNHPEVKQVEDEIRTMQRRMNALDRAFTSVQTTPDPLAQQVDQELVQDNAELAPLADEIVSYGKLIDSIKAELSGLESADTQLRSIEARIDSLNDNLKTMRANYEQARALDDMDRDKMVSVSQVEPAVASDKPVMPKKSIFLAGGLLIGLLTAAGVIVFAVITNNVIVTEAGAERMLNLPVLMTVPRLAIAAQPRRPAIT
jgi:uncharacterized protein involved in exopolysaccharide biosynthesis